MGDLDAIFDRYEIIDLGVDDKDIHLVLSGSGLKLFVFLVAIYVLHLLGYRFTKVTGTSGGAIIAAMLASEYSPDSPRMARGLAIKRMIRSTLRFDIPRLLDPQWFFWRIASTLSGMVKGKKILKALRSELPSSFYDLKMPCEVVVFQVNIADPRTRIITTGDLPLAVRASMSIPGVFSPVKRNGQLLVDGGFQMNLGLPPIGDGVIALGFGFGDDNKAEDVTTNLGLLFKLADGAVDEGVRRSVERSKGATLIKLNTSIGSLNFFLSEDDKIKGMLDGADSVIAWAKER